jgi:hypothetical protein
VRREEAERALASTDWTNATVERGPRQASIVHSVRIPIELSKRLEAEADRQGVAPSILIRDLVTAALLAAEHDETVTVRVADLHRAIDLAVQRAA